MIKLSDPFLSVAQTDRPEKPQQLKEEQEITATTVPPLTTSQKDLGARTKSTG